ncbi:MAG: hypothetical protein WDM96_15385 [Lacunisphaera sp.]
MLVLGGLFLRLTQPPDQLLWLGRRIGAITFASFIYKNHAGAYLALIAAVLLVLAARYRERSLREHARSSPALLPVLGALAVFFAVIFTYSRGATLLLGAYLLAAGLAFALHRYFTQSNSRTPRSRHLHCQCDGAVCGGLCPSHSWIFAARSRVSNCWPIRQRRM